MSDETITAPAIAPKVDPETLVIRARLRRAIRFRRGAIVGIAALGSASLMTIAWVALKPISFHHLVEQEQQSQPSSRPATDALNGLPASYAETPKLEPPLPGDLGRPILDHERSLETPVDASRQQAEQAQAAERERQATELKAARESGVLFQSRQASAPVGEQATPSAATQPADAAAPAASKLALDPERDPNAQARKAEFVGAFDKNGPANPHRLTPAASPYVLSAGSVISASLITGLRSDLPGLVTAQVTENVFDSPTGRILLVPQGARLIGSYDSVVAFGQRRALLVWQRIVMPDGSSLQLDNLPAADPSGYVGLEDKVDFHTWSLLKGVALSTLLGVSSELAFTGNSDLVQAIRRSTQDNVSRAGDQITQRNLNVQPTNTVRPGAPVRLVVHRDLILAPWRG